MLLGGRLSHVLALLGDHMCRTPQESALKQCSVENQLWDLSGKNDNLQSKFELKANVNE